VKYRKRPLVIDAFCWTAGPDQQEDPDWICHAINAGTVRFLHDRTPQVVMLIDTPEGTMRAERGDWIIRGIQGEIYPCKPDIFEASYEEAE
jgi:hypothetical protein